MTKRKVAALLAVVVLGLAAFWPERRKEEFSSAPQKAESPLPVIVAEVRTEQVAEVAAAVPVVAANPDTQVRVPGPPGPMSATPSPGMYRKYPSDDFSMYMALMNISSALQGRTRHEITDYDAVPLLNSQKREVGEVIEKFCSYDNRNRP